MKNSSAAVLLTVDDVAKELDVQRIAVHRLVARGRLKATALTDPLNLRFTNESLPAYIQAGAPDLKMPVVNDRWFVGPDRTAVDVRFRGAIQVAAEGQLLSDVALYDAFERQGKNVTVVLRASPEIQSVFKQAPPPSLFRITGQTSTPEFPLISDAFLTLRLRVAAYGAVKLAAKPMDNLLLTFFASPTAYNGFVGQAIAEVSADSIRFEEVRNLEARNGTATVTYSLPLATWATRQRLADLAEKMAF